MAQNFANKITLQLPNENDYRNVIDAPKGLLPAKAFGRGIIYKDGHHYEFQTASISDGKNFVNYIKSISNKMNEAYQTKAIKIKSIPNEILVSAVDGHITDLKQVPMGMDIDKKNLAFYNFTENNINLMFSNEMDEKMNFIYGLVKVFTKCTDTNVIVLDFVKAFNREIASLKYYNENFDQVVSAMENLIKEDSTSTKKNLFIFIAPGNMKTKMTSEAVSKLYSILDKANT